MARVIAVVFQGDMLRVPHFQTVKEFIQRRLKLVVVLPDFPGPESLAGMTQTDEMELWSLGEKKTAIFAVIPDNDSSFNFIQQFGNVLVGCLLISTQIDKLVAVAHDALELQKQAAKADEQDAGEHRFILLTEEELEEYIKNHGGNTQ